MARWRQTIRKLHNMEGLEASVTAMDEPAPLEPDDGGRPAAVRAVTIETLVARGPASVRLTNTIERGVREGIMPCTTVGNYLDAGQSASAMFMTSLYAFGRGTARELETLIDRFLEEAALDREACLSAQPGSFSRSPDDQSRVEQSRIEALILRLDGLTYAEAIRGEIPSVRLGNALSDPVFGARPVSELFTGGAALRAELMRKTNFGRKSLVELEEHSHRAVIRVLARDTTDPEILLAECALLFQTPDEDASALARLILETLTDAPPHDCDLDALIDWALPELPERELAILRRRYGFDTGEIQTLEEISETYHVTRERVRQLEAKGLRRLRSKLAGAPLEQVLADASQSFWVDRAVPYIAARDSYQVRKELPARIALALDIAGITLATWLEQTATAMSYGFLCNTQDVETVRALGAELEAAAATRSLPIALTDLLGDWRLSDVETAICVESRLAIFDGYLFRERPGTRLKRTVRLHAILAAKNETMTLYALGDAYRGRHREDPCSLRDMAIVMEISPQLFVEIEDGIWFALGQGAAAAPNALAVVPFMPAIIVVDQTTIAGCIQDALQKRGPTAVGELYRDGDQILEEGRSRNSIAPVLIGRPDLFHRILPGVYALPDQLPTPDDMRLMPLPYWLNEPQARAYVFARRAGEPWGTFAFWTPDAEFRLCTWARFDAPDALFHSLLAVAAIDEWPIDAVQKAEWHRLAEIRGRFELAVVGREPFQEMRPELDRLLAACRAAIERGSLNWLLVNRIMGRRLDAAGGQSLLALMIALGCVSIPEGENDEARLLSHPVTPRAATIADEIAEELMLAGEADWDSEVGRRLSQQALATDSSAVGWVSLERLADVIGGYYDAARADEADDDEEEGDDLIARLMREHRRGIEHSKRAETAAWLLEE